MTGSRKPSRTRPWVPAKATEEIRKLAQQDFQFIWTWHASEQMQFSITEQEYDTSLNPIRAEVSLSLRVLSYNDFSVTHPGYYVFLAHQVVKEVMATISSVGSIAAAGSASVNVSV